MISPATMPSAVNSPWLKPKAAARADTVTTLTLGIRASRINEPNNATRLAKVKLEYSLTAPLPRRD